MPTPRQLAILCAIWGVVAWFTTALWSMKAQDAAFAEALTRYYTVRAPIVGALAGVIWAPLLAAGYLPGRAGTLVGRRAGLAVERRTRLVFRLLQGAVVGQVVGATATILLLVMWPNDMQNTRWDAFKWGALFWRLYWYLLVPAGAVAGVVSVWATVRLDRARGAIGEAA